MANPEHIEILKNGVERWNDWSQAHPEVHADLRDGKLTGINLGGANLRGALLSNADLSEAMLNRANLQKADLSKSNLSGADLTDADLSEAVLFEARLNEANLSRANFASAILFRTTFGNVDLSDASLHSAKLFGTVFNRTCLKTTKGLETCEHSGPSSIDYQTLTASGALPESFLRGCGLSEDFIRYLPSFLNQPIQFYSCFISYSHEDKAFARLLHDRLQGHGIRCWLDEHQLLPGDDLHERIDQGIRLWDKVLLCASKSSLTSWWVDGEINRTFQKEAPLMKERGKKVLALIPLNLDGFLFSDEYQSGKKSEIKGRIAANFVGWEKDHALFDRELEKVIRALKTDDAGREKPPAPRL